MMPSAPTHARGGDRHFRRSLAGGAHACIDFADGPSAPRQTCPAPSAPLIHPSAQPHPAPIATLPDRFGPTLPSPSQRPNPHRARCTATAQPTAISCLGAFRTPAAPARGEPRRCRHPKTCTCVDGSGLAREIFTSRCWSVRPCVRPVSAVRMTAGHNALRGSGPGQKPAFDNAVARVGCPDRRIDRLYITCCSPSQPSHHAGCRRDLVHAASAAGSL